MYRRSEKLEDRIFLSTVFTVTTDADSGAGSLRAAIAQANAAPGSCVIDFAIPGAGVHTISLLSALPTITQSTTIDGTSQTGYAGLPLVRLSGVSAGAGVNGLSLSAGGCQVLGLNINRFSANGILIQTGGGDTIAENFIGTDPTGIAARGNGGSGIAIVNSGGNIIGSAVAGQGNLISADTLNGVRVAGAGSTGNSILGNLIGTDVSGTFNIGNGGNGVAFSAAGANATGSSGAPNRIAFNIKDGVLVNGASSDPIRFNSIYSNGGIGIDLVGGNSGAEIPVLSYASSANGSTAVGGTLSGASGTTYRVQFFIATPDASGAGQGRRLIGTTNVTVGTNGTGNFLLALAHATPAGSDITATATDPMGNTSQFAVNVVCIAAVFPSNDEEYLVALTNRARANPDAEAAMDGIDLNEGPPSTPITSTPKQPLAINPFLVMSAEGHSQWMISAQTFSHYGPNNETPDQRMTAAGYVFSGSYGWGENIAEQGSSQALNPDTTTLSEHNALFIDSTEPGRGHRVNIEDPSFAEIGTGVVGGVFQGLGSILATEDFADDVGINFLTGIAYVDSNGNNFYDPGEGMGGVTITATNVSNSASYSVVTWASGGYSLQLPNGTYNVLASGGTLGNPVFDSGVTISSANVEVDFQPVAAPEVARPGVAAVSFSKTLISGDSSSQIAGADAKLLSI